MEVIDKREDKDEEYRAGDVIEYWNENDDDIDHGFAMIFEKSANDNKSCIDLTDNLVSNVGYIFSLESLSGFSHIRKVNAKLVVED